MRTVRVDVLLAIRCAFILDNTMEYVGFLYNNRYFYKLLHSPRIPLLYWIESITKLKGGVKSARFLRSVYERRFR